MSRGVRSRTGGLHNEAMRGANPCRAAVAPSLPIRRGRAALGIDALDSWLAQLWVAFPDSVSPAGRFCFWLNRTIQ
ncbi:hypothetical protein VFPBJ_04179 [Purpureocillium lilacinum]|uniref:Uncharacterized protein n=1 Tax=Purpureocillium lilacinum TaxID=33203 RepID=A0A179GUF9_PURLI|nr:hypothetical protein VFPBJ_04179 [Purpureocillium lilacinum]